MTWLEESITRPSVEACTANYGKVKLVLQRNKFFLESPEPRVLRELLADEVIQRARWGLALNPFPAQLQLNSRASLSHGVG